MRCAKFRTVGAKQLPSTGLNLRSGDGFRWKAATSADAGSSVATSISVTLLPQQMQRIFVTKALEAATYGLQVRAV